MAILLSLQRPNARQYDITKSTFVQLHPSHRFNAGDNFDYSERNQHFIQCLKSLESLMDVDAYILDCENERILYATKGSSLFLESYWEDIKREGAFYFIACHLKRPPPGEIKMFLLFMFLCYTHRL